MNEQTRPELEPEYAGTIGATVDESTPWWPVRRHERRPNVVIVVLDDVGFAQLGCYGSSIRTPYMDALAGAGVRYTNFHVTGLCSTTRACVLTGRNHHAVGVGFLAAFDTGYPGYRGAMSTSAATIAEVLQANGYGTYASGKWHLTPPGQMSPAGPFDQWPTQRGFDRYYGFLLGEDDQWHPELWYDQHRVDPPADPAYHLSSDLVGRCEEFLSDHLSARPDDPFLLYLAFGACHAPHQAPRDYIQRYAGHYDRGWDVERAETLQRQKESGLVPLDTDLAPRNPGVPAWDTLSPERRRLYARMQEVFAGFMQHTDDQIGRLVAFLTRHDLLDDTLVLVLSDNGASGEGGEHGTANEYRYFLGLGDSLEDALAAYDDLGGPTTHNHYPAGWAQSGNTPLKFYKKHTYGGGIRAPLIAHWPAGLDTEQPLRRQFHHAIDLLPTVAEIAGAEIPLVYKGIPQIPLHGTSMAYTFGDPDALGSRRTQYFETAGYRGIYHEGWKAVTNHTPGTSYDDDHWALYRLADDFSECHDLAAEDPERVSALRDAWWQAAREYGVLPLDDRMGARVMANDPAADRLHYRLLPGGRLLNGVVGPSFVARSFRVTAVLGAGGPAVSDGVLLAYGRRASGFSWFVKGGRLVFDFNLAGDHTVVRTTGPVPARATQLSLVVQDGPRGVVARLSADDETLAEEPLPQLLPGGMGAMSLQCGHNSPSAVSAEYDPPFSFAGDLVHVLVDLQPRTVDTSDAEWLAEMGQQ